MDWKLLEGVFGDTGMGVRGLGGGGGGGDEAWGVLQGSVY
jgi:hypothetical protein